MSCPITLSGISKQCKDTIGGIKELYIINKVNVEYAISNNIIDSITTLGDSFTTYRFKKQTGQFTTTATINDSVGSKFYTTDIVLKFNKQETAKRDEILELTKSPLVIIILDNNGKYWYVGIDNGVDVSSVVATSGTNFGDGSNYEITLQDISINRLYEVNGSEIDVMLWVSLMYSSYISKNPYSDSDIYNNFLNYVLNQGVLYTDFSYKKECDFLWIVDALFVDSATNFITSSTTMNGWRIGADISPINQTEVAFAVSDLYGSFIAFAIQPNTTIAINPSDYTGTQIINGNLLATMKISNLICQGGDLMYGNINLKNSIANFTTQIGFYNQSISNVNQTIKDLYDAYVLEGIIPLYSANIIDFSGGTNETVTEEYDILASEIISYFTSKGKTLVITYNS